MQMIVSSHGVDWIIAVRQKANGRNRYLRSGNGSGKCMCLTVEPG